jgi:hypothetical protein
LSSSNPTKKKAWGIDGQTDVFVDQLPKPLIERAYTLEEYGIPSA